MDILFDIALKIYQYATGQTGAIIFTLAIVGAGYACLAGKLAFKYVLLIVAAAVLTFGSKWVASNFFGVTF